MIPKPFWGYPLQKAHVFLASAVSLALVASACSSSATKAKTVVTSPGTAVTVAGGGSAITTSPGTAVTSPTTTTTTVGSGGTTATTATTVSATATDWEVVVGTNYATEALATAQVTKLTAATFTGFSTKKLTKTYAVVLPGLTKDAATALAAKINAAKVGTATTFQLTTTTPTATTKAGSTTTTKAGSTTTKAGSTTVASTGTNFEVVAGIFSSSAKAQAQIDKLTKATFTGFSIKPTGTQFAVILAGLTNAQASDLAKKISNSGIALAYVKQL